MTDFEKYSNKTEEELLEDLDYLNREIVKYQAILAHYTGLYKAILGVYNLKVSCRIEGDVEDEKKETE